MFQCKKCQALEEEVRFLRDMNRTLLAKVEQRKADQPPPLAPKTPLDGYFGDDDGKDQYVAADPFGQRVLVEKDPLQ